MTSSNNEPFERPSDPTEEGDCGDGETSPYATARLPDMDEGVLDPPSQDSAIGRLGKYDVFQKLGSGGMGVVLLAQDPDLQRKVAIKILNRHLSANATARRRFLREARAAAAVNHPNVVTIHSVEEQHGVPFLVMEWVPGDSLREHIIKNRRLAPTDVIRLGSQIALGLAAAHAQGVIHRDVKPANVLLHEGATRARITDFGLARVAFDIGDLTSAGAVLGTPAYMAPEQVRGEVVDCRSDLFSLGCVLYAMIAGSSPFAGKTHAEIAYKIANIAPLPLSERQPGTPEILLEVVGKLLEKDPNARIQTAQEVAEILSRCLSDLNRAKTDEIPFVLNRPYIYSPPGTNEKATDSATTALKSSSKGTWYQRKAVWMGALTLALLTAAWQGRGLFSENSSSDSLRSDLLSSSGAVAAQTLLPELSVAQDGSQPFRTIGEAIAQAQKDATITIHDDRAYSESLQIGEHFDGLKIIALKKATLSSAEDAGDQPSIIHLSGAKNVLIRGVRLEAWTGEKTRAMILEGAASVRLEEVEFTPKQEVVGGIALRCKMTGVESRLEVDHCQFNLSTRGIGIWIDSSDPPGNILITNNRFVGQASQLVIFEGCRKLQVSGNLFIDGTNAINVNLNPLYPETAVEIVNNTFSNTQYWLGLLDTFKNTGNGKIEKAVVANNLILGGERIQGTDSQIVEALNRCQFAGNVWEFTETTKDGAHYDGKVAESVDNVRIENRENREAPDFLQPAADSPIATTGIGGDLSKYVGAIAPKSN